MQNLFDLFPLTGEVYPPGTTGRQGQSVRSYREYWLDRMPSFGAWNSSGKVRRTWLLAKQVAESIHCYWPREFQAE